MYWPKLFQGPPRKFGGRPFLVVGIWMNLLSQNSEHLLLICARNLLLFLIVSAKRSNDKSEPVAVFQTWIPSLVIRSNLLSNGFVDVDGTRTTGADGVAFMMNS